MKKSSKIILMLMATLSAAKAFGVDIIFPNARTDTAHRPTWTRQEIAKLFETGQIEYDPKQNLINIYKEKLKLDNQWKTDDEIAQSLREHLGNDIKFNFILFQYMDNPTQDRE